MSSDQVKNEQVATEQQATELQQEQKYMEQLSHEGLDNMKSLESLEPPEQGNNQDNTSMELYTGKKLDIQEGYTPVDLDDLHLPADLQGNPDTVDHEKIKEFNQEWAKKTPSWLDVYVEPKNKSYQLKKKVNPIKLGDLLLKVDLLEAFPKLPNGARYNKELGSWEVFKTSKVEKTIDATVMHTLRAWGTELLVNKQNYIDTTSYVSKTMFKEYMKENPFDTSKPYIVTFRNGTFNMKTGEFKKEHNPHDYILNGHNYDLELNTDTPETDKYLDALIGDSKQFMYEYLGYGFYRSYKPFAKIVFFQGRGGNGKSYMINEVFSPLYGEDNISHVAPDKLAGDGSRFEIANFYQKEMNIVPDIKDKHMKNTDKIKSLSGSDPQEAEFKGVTAFPFKSYAKMIFSANKLPTFSEIDPALRSRFITIRMVNQINTREQMSFWNQFDMKKVKAERGRLAYKCMLAFKKIYFDSNDPKFTISKNIEEATDEWFDDNDHFGQWIKECKVKRTRVTEENKNTITGESTKYTLQEIKAFYDQNGYKGVPSSQTVTNKLKEYGIIKARSRKAVKGTNDNVMRYLGLEIGISSFTDKERLEIDKTNDILKNI